MRCAPDKALCARSVAGLATDGEGSSTGIAGCPLSTVDNGVTCVSFDLKLSDTADLPVVDVEAAAGQRIGDVGGDSRGDDRLLGLSGDEGELVTSASVQLGEHVVENQHRLEPVVAQQLVPAQPQCHRRRPRLTVAGVAAHRRVAECQRQLVAMRTDQVYASLEL